MTGRAVAADVPDGPASWRRLGAALTLSAIGGVGMWSVVVALPAVQAEFGVGRSGATLPYTVVMVAVAFGGVAMGFVTDRVGVARAVLLGTVLLGLGYVAASFATSLALYALAHVLIGLGTSATFAPLLADISLWFRRRRGIAVAIVASGNYLAGAVWPPVITWAIANSNWRTAHLAIGLAGPIVVLPLIAYLRRRPTFDVEAGAGLDVVGARSAPLAMRPGTLQALLLVAGLACCVAMAMPQVHLVSYCGDLGYGVARGAEMLSLMLGLGIVSRIGSGFIADRIGGVRTLLLGSALQGVALFLYLLFDGLTSLYVISALFGLFQGGIVPSYAIIVRENFRPEEAGARIGACIMATLFGMALGGWMSALVFDWTGSYRAAFLNGLAFNLLNGVIAVALLMSPRAGRPNAGRPAHAVA
jgi:MFS family permease